MVSCSITTVLGSLQPAAWRKKLDWQGRELLGDEAQSYPSSADSEWEAVDQLKTLATFELKKSKGGKWLKGKRLNMIKRPYMVVLAPKMRWAWKSSLLATIMINPMQILINPGLRLAIDYKHSHFLRDTSRKSTEVFQKYSGPLWTLGSPHASLVWVQVAPG